MVSRSLRRRRPSAPASTAGSRPACWSLSSCLLDVCASRKSLPEIIASPWRREFQRKRDDVNANMNYESEFIMRTSPAFGVQIEQFRRSMINLSSFIAFHTRQTPQRCALKYRGQEISYAAFNERIRTVGGWLASRGI